MSLAVPDETQGLLVRKSPLSWWQSPVNKYGSRLTSDPQHEEDTMATITQCTNRFGQPYWAVRFGQGATQLTICSTRAEAYRVAVHGASVEQMRTALNQIYAQEAREGK